MPSAAPVATGVAPLETAPPDATFALDERVPNFYDGPIPNDIARRAWVHIRWRATKLAKAYGFDRSTRDDIFDELWLDLLRRWPNYDPTKSEPQAFIASVVLNRIADIMAKRVMYLREQVFHEMGTGDVDDSRKLTSLNTTVKVGKDKQKKVAKYRLLPETIHERRLGYRRRSERELRELQYDVRRLVAKLPADDRYLCEMLMKFSVAEVGRRMKMPESTLRDKLKRLRKHFLELADYLNVKRQ